MMSIYVGVNGTKNVSEELCRPLAKWLRTDTVSLCTIMTLAGENCDKTERKPRTRRDERRRHEERNW